MSHAASRVQLGLAEMHRLANGLNQYTTAGPAAFAYDTNSNLTSDGSASFVYDAENRLVSAGGGRTASLLYDGDELAAEYEGPGAGALLWPER